MGSVMTHMLRPWEGSASRLWVRGCQGRTRGDQSWASIFTSMAVLVTPTCCDPLSRRAVRVSMGTLFQIPWTFLGTDASQWPQPGLERLKELGFQTAAMALDSTALSIEDPRLRAAEKLAILLGAEGDGLAPRTIAQCDFTVCIPMARGVDSLNVAAASAVAFWELRAR